MLNYSSEIIFISVLMVSERDPRMYFDRMYFDKVMGFERDAHVEL